MKLLNYLAVFSIGALLSGRMNAEPAALASMGDADTNWPGIKFEVVGFKHIPTNRLLVSVALLATPKAPVGGTYIGLKPDRDSKGSSDEAAVGNPFSLSPSTLTDEKTSQKYVALKPDPTGLQYIPGEVQTTMRPGQLEIMTVQFEVPPPLPDTGHSEKQYVDLLLPNAKTPIRLVVPSGDAGSIPKAN